MPKLAAKVAKAVNATEAAGSFEPIPAGIYAAVLKEVETHEGDNGTYWSWVFEIPEGYEFEGRRFWNNSSLSEKARPFLKKVFDAFGVPADTDTDELCGQWVNLRIAQRTIKSGDRKGELGNTIAEVLPYDGPDDDDDDDDDEDDE
jgi:hypothetical protein